ncbi:conserved hypothetical protein [Solidesulfovibrio fructosivorans JJ]]|uniref:Uncharacterized protein n=2 Tax=Solidesulfovibrio fructosivorans TaxID=878 RepID=E1JQY6_SOLFR|nr:conserved hypothetical protein [Solidesulfovibrio fructosivorans JJ]]
MNGLSEKVRNNNKARQVRLRIFLLENGIESRELARKRGLSPGAMGDVLSGRRPKREHIEWLIAQGIPGDLLPEPAVPQKRGPKPRTDHPAL